MMRAGCVVMAFVRKHELSCNIEGLTRPWFAGGSNFQIGWRRVQQNNEQVFTGSPRPGRADGYGSRRRARIALGGCGIDSGKRAGVPTNVADKLKTLKRENRELREANEILRKASAYFAQAELDRPFKR